MRGSSTGVQPCQRTVAAKTKRWLAPPADTCTAATRPSSTATSRAQTCWWTSTGPQKWQVGTHSCHRLAASFHACELTGLRACARLGSKPAPTARSLPACPPAADFNLSKILRESEPEGSGGVSAPSTSAGATNPIWLAPEVLQGKKAVAASDVYAFGGCGPTTRCSARAGAGCGPCGSSPWQRQRSASCCAPRRRAARAQLAHIHWSRASTRSASTLAAAGIVLYEMLTWTLPYSGMHSETGALFKASAAERRRPVWPKPAGLAGSGPELQCASSILALASSYSHPGPIADHALGPGRAAARGAAARGSAWPGHPHLCGPGRIPATDAVRWRGAPCCRWPCLV